MFSQLSSCFPSIPSFALTRGEITLLYEGTNQIQRIAMARALLGG